MFKSKTEPKIALCLCNLGEQGITHPRTMYLLIQDQSAMTSHFKSLLRQLSFEFVEVYLNNKAILKTQVYSGLVHRNLAK